MCCVFENCEDHPNMFYLFTYSLQPLFARVYKSSIQYIRWLYPNVYAKLSMLD